MSSSLLSVRQALASVVLLATLSELAFAQTGRGGLTGVVTDSSGAVIPNASVELVNVGTNTKQATFTGSSGLYSIAAVLPGTYRLAFTASGFQTVVRNEVRVEVDRVASVNAQLSPGEISQTVAVSAQAELPSVASSTVGQFINEKTLESLPTNGRNIYLTIQLSPGVIPNNGALNQTGGNNRQGIEVSAFKINGQRAGTLAYYFDGSPLTVMGYGPAVTSPAFSPPMDAVQEYRLDTNNMSATYAAPGTGLISLVSKSGTDKYHGSGFFFARPNAMVANDPFLKASQSRRNIPNQPPDFHRYQEGGSFGGPILKGKLFFFGDYEQTASEALDTLTTTLASAANRTGNFSDVPTIYNPFSVNSAGQRQPFPGNAVPKSMMDPVALNVQKFIPAPTQAGTGAYHSNNYFDATTFPYNSKKFDARLDYYKSQKHQIFGRYSYAKILYGLPDHYHNGADPLYDDNITRGQNVLMGDTYTLSPTSVLQFRYSYTRHAELQPVPDQVKDIKLTDLGFPASLAAQSLVHVMPTMNLNGLYGVGSRPGSINFVFISMNHDASVALNKVAGRHSIDVGFEYTKSFVNMGQPSAPSGQYNFDGTATASTTFAGNGYTYASYLLGMGAATGQSRNFSLDPFIAHASAYYGTFIQDTFRITQRLTLNMGLRWEIFGGRTERYGRQEIFDPNATYTVSGVQLKGGEVFQKGGQSPIHTNRGDIGPRFGFAYRITNSSIFHAGGGIFYGPSTASVAIASTNADSYTSNTVWNAVSTDQFGNSVMLNPLSNPFPNGLTPTMRGSLGLSTNLGNSLGTVWQNQPTPGAYNWNVGLQQSIGRGLLLSLAYVGSRGIHQISGIGLNQLSLEQIGQYNSQLGTQVANPYLDVITDPTSPIYRKATIPFYQAVTYYPQYSSGSPSGGVGLNVAPIEDTNYHSLQVQLERRLSAHFTSLASFTYGKTLSTGNGAYSYLGQSAGHQNWRNRNLDWAVDPQDVSKWFSWALFYDLPVGRGRGLNIENRLLNSLAGGWTINSGLYLSSGLPLVVSGSWPNKSTYFSQRPNLTCDPSADAPRSSGRWLLPSCYAVPASPYVAGTAPRTLSSVRANGVHNLDFSIFKSIKVRDFLKVQFRAEAYNLTNSVQYAAPNMSWNPVDTSTFGVVTSAVSSPRQLQFAVRATF